MNIITMHSPDFCQLSTTSQSAASLSPGRRWDPDLFCACRHIIKPECGLAAKNELARSVFLVPFSFRSSAKRNEQTQHMS